MGEAVQPEAREGQGVVAASRNIGKSSFEETVETHCHASSPMYQDLNQIKYPYGIQRTTRPRR